MLIKLHQLIAEIDRYCSPESYTPQISSLCLGATADNIGMIRYENANLL